jgi:hypothetical protein
VWIDADDHRALIGDPPPADAVAVIFFATHEGVRAQPLSDAEAMILDACDGRTLADVARDLAERIETDHDLTTKACIQLLLDLTALSPRVIDWSR